MKPRNLNPHSVTPETHLRVYMRHSTFPEMELGFKAPSRPPRNLKSHRNLLKVRSMPQQRPLSTIHQIPSDQWVPLLQDSTWIILLILRGSPLMFSLQ